MGLNEDYFKELNLTDEDVSNDVEQISNSNRYSNIPAYEDYLINHYDRCFIISTYLYSDIFSETDLWNKKVPNALRRVEQVLDAYNIEHETVILDYTDIKQIHIDRYYRVGDYNILSGQNNNNFFSKEYQRAYIIIYCNFPEFTYKESYNLVDRFTNALWRYEHEPFNKMILLKTVCRWNEFERYIFSDMHRTLEIYETHSKDIIHHEQPYKSFFIDAILSFHNTKKDYDKIYAMYGDI